MNQKTFEIRISGQVQGVGFRPVVYNLAHKNKLFGTVYNNENGVVVHINTSFTKAKEFLGLILEKAPENSKIQKHTIVEISYQKYDHFKIIPSSKKGTVNIPLTPDFAICKSCKTEIKTNTSRRFGYAFTTCTNCGPRYSVTNKFPFERGNTTISAFKMCANCTTEYTNSNDRRFHSQTNSCKTCGITLQLVDSSNRQFNGDQTKILKQAVHLLQNGSILAIKNTNGYILCCDATNKTVIERLRAQKKRKTKPFALLYPSIKKIKHDFELSAAEEKALVSSVAPIVILNPKTELISLAQETIAPGLHQLGVMLPSSALLQLVMNELKTPVIATSGNIHGSPIIAKNEKALNNLIGVADYFLHHNLEISFPQDDSVLKYAEKQQLTLRRSRGLAPNFINLSYKGQEKILATGAHLKSTFCFVPNAHTYVSPYFGNLDNFDVLKRYEESILKHIQLFEAQPNVVLIDSHPQYQSSILGKQLAENYQAKLFSVQHHKAHFSSVLGEHHLFQSKEKILGVVWDGTGFGEDNAIWGGEFFTYQNNTIKRFSHFEYYNWIAADKMAKEPRLSLLSILSDVEKVTIQHKFSTTEWKVYTKLLENNLLKTASVGRLFDAVASLLDIIDKTAYEGEAAMLLENIANSYKGKDFIDFLNEESFNKIPTKILIKNIHKAYVEGISIPRIANSFIHTLALVILRLAQENNFKIICCSGGVFQNALLVKKLVQLTENTEIVLKFNCILSSNDENISFGQLCYFQHIKT